ncbi:hypothetical protein BASA50_009639 [Batrachochytrium salamandrivorans]|uniref:Membrane insertase YidC/Oxa/ALB C-terminal domain-containing protein n=1 Tax=Batrachochytrium salamandrivorans TaxID=1357716 RepID=A0ABQ8F0F7_9FUNG|nr:hypothetical protein BASA50_009639 [Batrachochytrium salamandrivorans]KAH9253025.1 hypothetical protein BASA81_009030 [Batrachochytrium salamandrivorans]
MVGGARYRQDPYILSCTQRGFYSTLPEIVAPPPVKAVTAPTEVEFSDLESFATPIASSASTTLSPVSLLVSLMDTIHSIPLTDMGSFNGTPWWLVICSTTVLLRSICTLPLAIQNKRRSDRLEKIQPLLKGWESTLGIQLKRLGRDKKDPERDKVYKKLYNKKVADMYRLHRCNPLYTFILPWVQIPLFISMSFALRWLAAFPTLWLGTPDAIAPGMDTEGVLWFDDLTVADPTLITPIMVGAIHLINIELNSLRGTTKQKQQTPGRVAFRLFMRSFALIMIPITAYVPMAIALYWLTSAVFSMVQNISFLLVKEYWTPIDAPAHTNISFQEELTPKPLPLLSDPLLKSDART